MELQVKKSELLELLKPFPDDSEIIVFTDEDIFQSDEPCIGSIKKTIESFTLYFNKSMNRYEDLELSREIIIDEIDEEQEIEFNNDQEREKIIQEKLLEREKIENAIIINVQPR